MARLWSGGFELNSSTTDLDWTVSENSPTIQTSVVRSGTYALQVTSLSSGAKKGQRYHFHSTVGNGPYYFRVYFRVATLPSAANTIIALRSDLGGLRAGITIDNTGVLQLFDTGGAVGSPSSALSLNTWYRIEIEFIRLGNGADATLKARVDGVEFASATNRTIGTGVGQFYVGGNVNAEAQTTGDWFFDDAAINDNSGSFQNSYPGAGSIVLLRPNGAGDTADWTGAYTDIDEVTPDDATTVIESTTLDQVEEVNLETSPTDVGTVNCVQVGTRFRADGVDEPSFVLRIKASASGTVEESTAITSTNTSWHTNSNTGPRNYKLTLYDLPGASTTEWTKADLDTAQIGARISVDNTDNIEISALWLLVDYIPASSYTPRSMLLGMG